MSFTTIPAAWIVTAASIAPWTTKSSQCIKEGTNNAIGYFAAVIGCFSPNAGYFFFFWKACLLEEVTAIGTSGVLFIQAGHMFQWVWFCTAVRACRTETVWTLVIVRSITKHKERKPQNPTSQVMTTTCEIRPYWTGACGCPAIDIRERKTTPEPCSCESPLQLVAFIRHLPAHPASPVLCSLAAVAL